VRRTAHSRGGSAILHESVREGDVLAMDTPQNLFPIPRLARAHVLLAAGIGVTPFLAYLPALSRAGIPVALHLFCRPDEAAAFRALVGDRATLHTTRTPFADLLGRHPVGAHVSVCGPTGFMDDATRAAIGCGFPPAKIHRESFGGAAPGRPFVAILARHGVRIAVDAETSLLEALEAGGIDAPSLCRGGVCGQCRLAVLAGTPEHRDHVLSQEERARGDCIMSCVSRAASAELVLDL
jgi:ferredoxin-NADP reductase